MAKTLIKILVSLLILHGAFRLGMAYWDFYRLEDALEQIALFGERRPDRQLCDDAVSQAASYNIPLDASALTLFRGMNPPFGCGASSFVDPQMRPTRAGEIGFLGSYVTQVTLLPGYQKPWDFQVRVAVRATP